MSVVVAAAAAARVVVVYEAQPNTNALCDGLFGHHQITSTTFYSVGATIHDEPCPIF